MSELMSTAAQHALDHPELENALEQSQAGPSSMAMGDGAASLSIEEAFEVDSTVECILQSGYKTIGLQFPDELLPSSVAVYRAIQTKIRHTGAQAYVLADSTYGSCCPDILSCLHLPADFLVHYGHACLTPTDAIPVQYVFPRRKLDVDCALEKLLQASKDDLEGKEGKGVVVFWDVAYDWLADEIINTFSKISTPINFATIHRPSTTTESENEIAQKKVSAIAEDNGKGKGKAPALRDISPPDGVDMSDCVLWYIGEEGRAVMNLQMTHAANSLYLYSAKCNSTKALHQTTSRLLSRRLYALHQALSADIFGLIVSNIGLASSKPLLDQLRADLKRAKKKSYTLSVGRLNPAKLANFSEIECFVLVGCNEGGVVDSKDFLRPIITPWELELALQGSEHVWAPEKWTLDLSKVLQDAQAQAAAQISEQRPGSGAGSDSDGDSDSSDGGPEFSLISGKMRTKKRFTDGSNNKDVSSNGTRDLSLTLRNQNFSLAKLEASAGSAFLASREFKGLEPRYGMDEPSLLEEGRSGVARGYTEEK